MANITNLVVNDTIKTGGEKVIALNQQNIDMLKKGYNSDPIIIAANQAVSNKDLLSQSFATPVEQAPVLEVAPPVVEVSQTTNEAAPLAESIISSVDVPAEPAVQLTGIPTVQNTVNLENAPANMSMEPTPIVEENTMDPLSGLENLIPNTDLNVVPIASETSSNDLSTGDTTVENTTPILVEETPAPVASGVEVKVETPSIESPFQVTAAPNIFDQPVEETTQALASEPESAPAIDLGIPSTIDVSVSTTPETVEMKEEKNEGFDPLNILPESGAVLDTTDTEINKNQEISTTKVELSNDILQAEIALEKEAADLYEKLAQNSRKKIELLEQKRKTTSNNNTIQNISDGPSASDLFNVNGTLNDDKVLEEANSVLKLVA